jgi:citrate synthase
LHALFREPIRLYLEGHQQESLMSAVVDIKKGLEGVVVDSTSISLVDGEAGRLYYRGW